MPPALTVWSDNNNNADNINHPEIGIDNLTETFSVTTKTTQNTFDSTNADWTTRPVLNEGSYVMNVSGAAYVPKALDATTDVTFTFI